MKILKFRPGGDTVYTHYLVAKKSSLKKLIDDIK